MISMNDDGVQKNIMAFQNYFLSKTEEIENQIYNIACYLCRVPHPRSTFKDMRKLKIIRRMNFRKKYLRDQI